MKGDIKLQNWRASPINSTASKNDFNSYNTLPTVKAQINEYGLKVQNVNSKKWHISGISWKGENPMCSQITNPSHMHCLFFPRLSFSLAALTLAQ